MLGETAGTVYSSVIKAGGIVIHHRSCVIAAVFVNQSDLFNLIFILVQLIENFYEILGYFLIANQFSDLNLTVKIIVKYIHIAKLFIGNGNFLIIGDNVGCLQGKRRGNCLRNRIGNSGNSGYNGIRKGLIEESVCEMRTFSGFRVSHKKRF